MKKITVPCHKDGKSQMFDFFISDFPYGEENPLKYQSQWLKETSGFEVHPGVVDSLIKLRKLSEQNDVSFEELVIYALEMANREKRVNDILSTVSIGTEEVVLEF